MVSGILWRRLRYSLTPQWDIYKSLGPHVDRADVLEVGFGTGLGASMLSVHAHFVLAIDNDPQAVEFAAACFGRPELWFSHNDICDMVSQPLPTGAKFSAAVMVEVLEHIQDYKLALRNVRDLLREGGKLYVTARNANADLRRNDLHLREWSASEFVASLETVFGVGKVDLWDYGVSKRQDLETRTTPLVAVAVK